MHSISTSAPFGTDFTAKALRAGYGSLKNSAYTSFISPKSAMSESSTVVFTTSLRLSPASFSIACALSSDCRVCAFMPSGNLPVAGSIGSCPLAYTKPFTSTPWLYGPMAAGAFFVLIAFISPVFLFVTELMQNPFSFAAKLCKKSHTRNNNPRFVWLDGLAFQTIFLFFKSDLQVQFHIHVAIF